MQTVPEMVREVLSQYVKCRNYRKNFISNSKCIRLMLGAAGKEVEGWLSTDLDILDAVRAMNWSFLFRKNSIEAILAEHVWEHLDIDDARRAARNCYRYLKTGGHLRLAVPDGYHPDQAYIEYVKPGGSGIGSDTHKHLYTYRDLTTLLNGVGFEVDLLEYWDECGQFHYKSWEKKDGLVLRSMNYDKRNRIVPLSYTSLIVDARK